jgi:hypothetical protein
MFSATMTSVTIPVGRVLAEMHLAAPEPHVPARLYPWLCDALEGCTTGAVREAGIILGELVMNAFRHAAPPFRVRLTTARRGHLIRLAVTDGAPGGAEGWGLGRGLLIVRGLCPQWGVAPDQVAGADGKSVWAELPVMVPPAAAAGP